MSVMSRLKRLEGNLGDPAGCPACERVKVTLNFVDENETPPPPWKCERCGRVPDQTVVRMELVETREQAMAALKPAGVTP